MSLENHIKLIQETSRVFIRDLRGVVAIEFALVMLPFSLLVFGIIEVAALYVGAMSLENAVASAGRQIRTGAVQSAGDADAQLARFNQIFCAELTAVVTCNGSPAAPLGPNFSINVNSFSSFNLVTFTPLLDEDGELIDISFAPGGGRTINLIQVAYSYDIMTPLLGLYLGDGSTGRKTLEASTVVRNEPF